MQHQRIIFNQAQALEINHFLPGLNIQAGGFLGWNLDELLFQDTYFKGNASQHQLFGNTHKAASPGMFKNKGGNKGAPSVNLHEQVFGEEHANCLAQ